MDKTILDSNTFKRAVMGFVRTVCKLGLEEEEAFMNMWQEMDMVYLDYVAAHVESMPNDTI